MPTSVPPLPTSSSALTSLRATLPLGCVAASSTRCSTSTSCTHRGLCWPPCPSVTSTYSTVWPNTASMFTRGRLEVAASLTDAYWDNVPPGGVGPLGGRTETLHCDCQRARICIRLAAEAKVKEERYRQ